MRIPVEKATRFGNKKPPGEWSDHVTATIAGGFLNQSEGVLRGVFGAVAAFRPESSWGAGFGGCLAHVPG